MIMVIVRGLPGSGKTTLAKRMQDAVDGPCELFAADDFYETEDGYKWDPEKPGAGHMSCVSKVRHAAKRGTSVIVVHNTFVKRSSLREYLKIAENRSYHVREFVAPGNVRTDEELAARCVHGVDASKIAEMREAWDD